MHCEDPPHARRWLVVEPVRRSARGERGHGACKPHRRAQARPQRPPKRGIASVSALFHLHQTTVEGWAATHVGEPLGSQEVHILAIRGLLGPSHRGCANDSRRHALTHPGDEQAEPRSLKTRTWSPEAIDRGAASSAHRCNSEVCRSVEARLPKVEFMLSSFLGEMSSKG